MPAANQRVTTLLQNRAILALCLAAFPTSICLGDDVVDSDAVPVEEIHILASRIERFEIKLPIDRIVIDSETIERLATTDILDLLRGQSGIDSFRQGGPGSKAFLSIRGGDPNFTVLMLDGIRLNNPTDSRGGGFDTALLDLTAIESIEIVKGAQATAYGADALSGVINIITHRPQKRADLSLSSGVDTNNGLQFGANLRGPLGKEVAGALSATYSDGGTALEGDRRQRFNLGSQLFVNMAGVANIRFTAFLADGSATAFPEDSGGARLAILRQFETRKDRLTTVGTQFAFHAIGRWQPTLSLRWMQASNFSDHPGVAPGTLQGIPASVTDTRFRQIEFTASNRLTLSERLTINLGGGLRSESGLSESVLDFGIPVNADFALKRTITSAFGHGRLLLTEGFHLGFGMRFDRLDDASDQFTSRLSASYSHTSSGTKVEISWGQGFKQPSFFALGHPLVGNSQLAPEEAQNFSLTIRKAIPGKRVELVVSGFHNRFRNLIDFDPVLFQTVNRTQVRTEGVEIGFVSRPGDGLELVANVTYQNIRVPGTQTDLRFRPVWKGNIQGSWHVTSDLSVTLSGFVNGRYFDSSIPTGPISRSGFSRFDATANWTISAHTEVILSVSNLLDSGYEEAIGFPSLPRSARLKLTARL